MKQLLMQAGDEMQHIQTAIEKARSAREPSKSAPVSIVARLDTLSLWDRLGKVAPAPARLIAKRIYAVDATHPHCWPFDMLRTKVFHKMRQNGWTSIAVTSPTQGCGKSVVAMNLAIGLSRHEGCRTLLMDFNLRSPKVVDLLDIYIAPRLEALLSGQCSIEDAILRFGHNLAVAANGQIPARPSELLQSPQALRTLEGLRQSLDPQFVVFDLPALYPRDEAVSFLPHVDCALIVLGAEETSAKEADIAEFDISQVTSVAGVVLNKCRYE